MPSVLGATSGGPQMTVPRSAGLQARVFVKRTWLDCAMPLASGGRAGVLASLEDNGWVAADGDVPAALSRPSATVATASSPRTSTSARNAEITPRPRGRDANTTWHLRLDAGLTLFAKVWRARDRHGCTLFALKLADPELTKTIDDLAGPGQRRVTDLAGQTLVEWSQPDVLADGRLTLLGVTPGTPAARALGWDGYALTAERPR